MRPTRCPVNHRHKTGSRKCMECLDATVQTPCRRCQKWVSSAGVAKHERRCAEGQDDDDDDDDDDDVNEAGQGKKKETRTLRRVAYVKGSLAGRGTYYFDEETGFMENGCHWLDVRAVTDSTIGGYTADVYDAIVARLVKERAIEVVVTFDNRTIVREKILNKEKLSLEEDVDVLFWPNWLFESGCDDRNGSMTALLEWVEQLRQFECCGACVIFPPIDHALFFGRKELWTSKAQLRFPVHANFRVIPTHVVFGPWTDEVRDAVRSFAQRNKSERLVYKRTVGERSERVYDDIKPEPDERQLKWLNKMGLGKFPFLIQPYVDDFQKFPEYRVYVLNGGEFLFGVESWFKDGGVLYVPFQREGRRDQDEARAVACCVARSFAQEAKYFLRVDLVRSSNAQDGWWINELEYFGNANILLPIHGDEVLRRLSETIKAWMSSVYSIFFSAGSAWSLFCRPGNHSTSPTRRSQEGAAEPPRCPGPR